MIDGVAGMKHPADGAGLHVGIIMDGNGRWAAARGLPRFEGHRRGVEALRRTVRAANELGVRYLTVYSFSSENWARPPQEIADLMGLLKLFIRSDLHTLEEAGVRVRIIGERDNLKPEIVALLEEAENRTRRNTKLDLIVAFNYGARQEIVEAARALARDVAAGRLNPEDIDEAAFAARLCTAGAPDPDLIIRTSGEMRLSNFLMWQAAYSELVFLPVFWPDFDRAAFEQAIVSFRSRERRFGGVGPAPVAKVASAS
ncbi:isoprenyl transferase [Rhodoblastus acidophilus]|uniref:Isoprenyl transferase n=1 Tax=Candidatus Rhodoblastus alkanivorans TaxID=2954117 RepID=A0ABS9Z6E2_9HYPH|nr:isoprenyl transferase [Candidatus Rhodoblastus alkanivorans]MCI4679198.1 isoprenyl transferase [Candidatus Rhodoblastus alkanivorans]MCI4683194.1 isoprenyl transferase [Candidatus Rhodoblastus alkanivorans]MDI4640506.1 isoprenyl transferase [Rhodoblastus acidophilus]